VQDDPSMIAQEVYNRFTADVTCAYHVGLNATTSLAGGFSAGFTRLVMEDQKRISVMQVIRMMRRRNNIQRLYQ